jgi:hypothetical protein
MTCVLPASNTAMSGVGLERASGVRDALSVGERERRAVGAGVRSGW